MVCNCASLRNLSTFSIVLLNVFVTLVVVYITLLQQPNCLPKPQANYTDVHLRKYADPHSSNASDKYSFKYLNDIGIAAGSGKSSLMHNFTRAYHQYFAKYKDLPIKVLEIGIYDGASVKMWEKYFPNAELHFIDVTPVNIKYNSTRSKYHFMNQADAVALTKFVNDVGSFDIIIDDGGHRMDDQIISFKVLFPHVNAGGLYVVEDLHTSYWTTYGGGGSPEAPKAGNGTAIDFLKNMIDEVNFVGASTGLASLENSYKQIEQRLNYYSRHIDAMHFYDSICFIFVR